MKLRNNRLIKLALVVVLVSVASASTAVVARSLQSDQETREKQQQLQELYNSSGAEQAPVESSAQQVAYANPKFAELLTINPDLVGWLEVGELSTPVVQGIDNDYYLTHDFYEEEDPHGTVFADSRNDVEAGDDNLVLYGHNYNKSKQMFYEVERYKSPEYAASHPIISFTTLGEKRDYVVFGVFLTNTEPSMGEVFDYHNQLLFPNHLEMDQFIAQVRARSMLDVDIAVDSFDQLITLSTCGYEFAGERVVLMARRIRPNEAADQFVSAQYTRNPSPIMPEPWVRLYGAK